MAQQGQSGASKRNLDVNVRTIEDGTRIETTDGATAEVVSNPHDGIWLLVRYLTSPEDPSLEGTEDMLWVDNVAGVVE
jgi:hypothetical protein